MRFPDWLYQLLPGDAGTQLVSVVWRDASFSDSALVVGGTVYEVPADKALVLTNMTGYFDAHGASNVERTRFIADPPAGTTRYNIFDYNISEGGGAAGAEVGKTWSGEVVIPPKWKVRVEGEYTSAAAANVTSGEIHGYLVPRGTFIFD